MFRHEFVTKIEIDAAAERVWKVLTDLNSFPQWNPMIRWAKGEVRPGLRLTVRFQPEGSRGYTFTPKLLVVETNRQLRWLGYPRIPKLIDTEHYWNLERLTNEKTLLMHGAVIYGWLTPVSWKIFEKSSRAPFEQMNHAHKQRAELKQAARL
ncbi:MAG: SRPBCC domain-containing protein [Deltaproteobacteria bacterium]|nr:SRPBCC domain-containing protein [Deltaproteobacteria bacterium]